MYQSNLLYRQLLQIAARTLCVTGLTFCTLAQASPHDPPPPPPDLGARTAATTPILPRGHKHLVAPKATPTDVVPISRPQGPITETLTLKQKKDQLKAKGPK